MTQPANAPWTSLEIAKLIVGTLTPIALALFGVVVNSSIREGDLARADFLRKSEALQRELDQMKRVAVTRQNAVGALSKYIYERHVQAEMLLSSVTRHAKSPSAESRIEVIDRKRQYDEAYINWKTNHLANLFLIRQNLDEKEYGYFEALIEFRLDAKVLAPLHECLTKAFDETTRSKDPSEMLSACHAEYLVKRSLSCANAIAEELFRLPAPQNYSSNFKGIVESLCPSEIAPGVQ